MSEFKIKCVYYGLSEKKFFRDKKPVKYYRFSLRKNIDNLPENIFAPSSVLRNKNEKGWANSWDPLIYCWLFISVDLVQKFNLNFEKDKIYQFVMKLGEPKTANFIAAGYQIEKGWEEHQLVLKTKQYWENTVQKIGFWDSENYFYEVNKKQKKPPQKQESQSENKEFWVKVAWICLPILFFFFCLFLLVKWINKRQK